MRYRMTSKIMEAAKSLIKGGMSHRKVSLCIALGIVLGIFPVIGTSTALCAIAAVALRLNLPIIQAVNYAVYPLQIILLAPFIGTGAWLFGNHRALTISKEIINQLQHDPWGGVAALWDLLLYGIAIWVIVSPFIVIIAYTVLKPVIHNLTQRTLVRSGFEP